jgi:hypothetical protein
MQLRILGLGACICALAVGSVGAGAQQVWRVKGGDTTVSILEPLLGDLGIRVANKRTTAVPSMDMEAGIAFAITPRSDLTFQADGSSIKSWSSGEIIHSGGFALYTGSKDFSFQSFRVRPDGGVSEGMFTMTGGSGRVALTADLRNPSVRLDPYSKTLTISYADMLLTPHAARSMGRADLDGQILGGLTVIARLELISGEVPPPPKETFNSEDGNDIDVQLFAASSLSSMGRTGTFPTGKTGFAMSTTSCNVGTAVIDWYAPMDKRHPVIAQNLYRIMNNRFEQIGFAWLKHGFLSTNSNGCGTCQQPPGGGNQLGLNCSDTYGTFNNSDRFYLGERKEVNPLAGTWECRKSWFSNYIDDCVRRNNGSGLDAVAHRLEVLDADLNVTGAEFWYEAYYLTKDDINKYNNVGYRRATVNWTGSQWSTTTNTNLVRDIALKVWDPNAVRATPNSEGDVWVGVRTIDLGGGQWKYLYAVYVHDLDRQVREVAIPIVNGANVTNIAFRDVDQTGANQWAGSYANGLVTFSTSTFQQDPNANSLTYSTVFNFEFDANVAPAAAPIIIGQFKPGNVAWRLRANNVAAPPAGYVPTTYQIITGFLGSGSNDHILDSDDAKLVVNAAAPISPLAPSAVVEFKTTSSLQTPGSIKFGFESSTSAIPAGSVVMKTLLWNYTTGQWVEVDSRAATAGDTAVVINVANPAAYVQAGTREMKARVQFFEPLDLISPVWNVSFDKAWFEISL